MVNHPDVCHRCGFKGNNREFTNHPCPNPYTLNEFPSVHWNEQEWYHALHMDDGLYQRILAGIGKETRKWKEKYHREPPTAAEYERMRARRGGLKGVNDNGSIPLRPLPQTASGEEARSNDAHNHGGDSV